MTIVTFSFANDVHAIAVDHVLKKRGIDTRLICISDHPDPLAASIEVDNGRLSTVLREPEEGLLDGARTVWNRRIASFTAPESSHPADRKAILQQGQLFWRALRATAFPNAFWVNELEAQVRADNKVLQLIVAERCGLNVARTLFSNDPQKIRQFVSTVGDCIAKPLSQLNWHGEGYSASAYTASVGLSDLEDDDAVRLMPMIYQARVEKAFELRIVIMGRSIISVRINSQDHVDSILDWRVGQSQKDLLLEPFELPTEIRECLFEFVGALGVVFGSVDMIVDRQGKFWFLEINEQGQFLFLEERCPDLKLLSAFSDFLVAASPTFELNPSSSRSDESFPQFLKSEAWIVDQPRRLAVHRPHTMNISERE